MARYDTSNQEEEEEEEDVLLDVTAPGTPRRRVCQELCSRCMCGRGREQRRIYTVIYTLGAGAIAISLAVSATLVLPVAVAIALLLGMSVNCLRLASELAASHLPRLRQSPTARSAQPTASRTRVVRVALDDPNVRARLAAAGLTEAGIAQLSLMMEDRDFSSEDYERLLALDDSPNNPSAMMQGASSADISRLPTFKWKTRRPTLAPASSSASSSEGAGSSSSAAAAAKEDDAAAAPAAAPAPAAASSSASSAASNNLDRCNVCLDSYVDGDLLRILPCLHSFHEKCINRWLSMKGICPMCKASITDPVWSQV